LWLDYTEMWELTATQPHLVLLAAAAAGSVVFAQEVSPLLNAAQTNEMEFNTTSSVTSRKEEKEADLL